MGPIWVIFGDATSDTNDTVDFKMQCGLEGQVVAIIEFIGKEFDGCLQSFWRHSAGPVMVESF